MRSTKIAIIGAGAVGAATAYALMWKNTAIEIILVDTNEKRCAGEVLDLSDALPFSCISCIKQGTLSDAAHADIIIIAAGARQKSGEPRDELLTINAHIIKSIMNNLKPLNPSALIIMVTNPVDTMAWVAKQQCNLAYNQVFGSGTFLDTQRLSVILARHLNIAEESINAYVLGQHGDMQCAAWSTAHIAGIPISKFPGISQSFLENIAQETKERVYKIIACKEATYYGIAACVADIVESIIFNKQCIIPISCFQEQFGVYLSMPTVVGAGGAGKIILPPLNKHEQEQLETAVKALRKAIKQIS